MSRRIPGPLRWSILVALAAVVAVALAQSWASVPAAAGTDAHDWASATATTAASATRIDQRSGPGIRRDMVSLLVERGSDLGELLGVDPVVGDAERAEGVEDVGHQLRASACLLYTSPSPRDS